LFHGSRRFTGLDRDLACGFKETPRHLSVSRKITADWLVNTIFVLTLTSYRNNFIVQENSSAIPSSVRGKIHWIILCFDGDDAAVWFQLLRSLLGSMPPKVKFLVCCSEQAHLDILWNNKAVWAKNRRVKKTTPGKTLQHAKCYLHTASHGEEVINIWCRDPFFFKSATHTPPSICLSKTGYGHSGELLRHSLNQLNFPYIHKLKPEDNKDAEALYLSGGNFLADEDFILVGFSEFQRTWNTVPDPKSAFRHSFADEQTALAVLSAWANGGREQPFRKICLVGKNIPVPKPSSLLGDKMFRHIDGYISLTGTYSINAKGEKKYILLVARIKRLFLPKNAAATDWSDILKEWNTFLDAVARQLESTGGFEVWRNPLPLFALCDWDWDTARPRPFRPYLGLMNNVLVEITKSSNKVWLPALKPAPYLTNATKTLAAIEQTNTALWQTLGFEVGIIDADFHPFWKWMGGLRCLTNHF
jgi:hypothetical protein